MIDAEYLRGKPEEKREAWRLLDRAFHHIKQARGKAVVFVDGTSLVVLDDIGCQAANILLDCQRALTETNRGTLADIESAVEAAEEASKR